MKLIAQNFTEASRWVYPKESIIDFHFDSEVICEGGSLVELIFFSL